MVAENIFTKNQTYHCSIQRFTVNSIPNIEKTVVNASKNGALSEMLLKYSVKSRVIKKVRLKYRFLSFVVNFVFSISCLSFFRFRFHSIMPIMLRGK